MSRWERYLFSVPWSSLCVRLLPLPSANLCCLFLPTLLGGIFMRVWETLICVDLGYCGTIQRRPASILCCFRKRYSWVFVPFLPGSQHAMVRLRYTWRSVVTGSPWRKDDTCTELTYGGTIQRRFVCISHCTQELVVFFVFFQHPAAYPGSNLTNGVGDIYP